MINCLKTLIKRCKERQAKIAVVGDLMVDQYYHIKADKLSPEFPIVRLLSDTDIPDVTVPGGAGNLCRQFQNFNITLQALGFIDEYGREIYNRSGINTSSCLLVNGHIPVKRRFYQDQFPLCRWDVEPKYYGMGNMLADCQELLLDRLDGSNEVIVFVDYNKGVFCDFKMSWFSQTGDAITIVDPKSRPIERWKGCTVFKLNAKEAQDLSGVSEWKEQCNIFQKELHCVAVVITHGGEGVYGKVGGLYFDYHSPYKAICESVIGAGDCFAAVLAVAMAHTLDIVDAAKIAYEAGAVYVGRKYNEPIKFYDILKRLDPIEAKFVDLDFLKDRNYKLAFTNGVYDLIHMGHVELLRYAKSLGDKLVVAINSDKSVKSIKSPSRPIIPLEQRMRIISELECVDFVISFDSDTPHDLIKYLNPEVLIKGADWGANIVGAEFAGKVVSFPLVAGLSTTNIIDKICQV